ncbi:MAG TPA: hypothetical protein VF800_05810 [Telluria sp.]
MKAAIMEWTGYLASIAGLLVILLTFDRPGWAWQAGGAVLVLVSILLIVGCRRERRSDHRNYGSGGYRIEDDVADVMDGDE